METMKLEFTFLTRLFFLDEGSELDQIVSKKATTIYLVDIVYHMLPQEMCLGCSLLPGIFFLNRMF